MTTYRELSERDCHVMDIFGPTLILLDPKGFDLQSLAVIILLSGSPQSIPQYIEVPPNVEGKQIISYSSIVFSYSSNTTTLSITSHQR